MLQRQVGPSHRRRIKTEEKAKIVAAVWGAKFVQFLAALAVLPRSIWKNKGCGKELNKFCQPNRRDNLCLVFYNSILLLWLKVTPNEHKLQYSAL